MSTELRGIVPLLEVFDVRRSIDFYREALGLETVDSAVVGDYVGWAWVRGGDVEVMFNAMYDVDDVAAPPDPARVAAHSDTTLYVGCPDVDGAYERLRAKGIATAPPSVAPYGMKQLSFRDPDGYGICLQWPAAAHERGREA